MNCLDFSLLTFSASRTRIFHPDHFAFNFKLRNSDRFLLIQTLSLALQSGPGASIREAKNMATYDCLRRLFNLSIAKQSYRFGAQAYDLDYASFDRPNQSVADFKVPQLERYLRPEPIAFS